MTKVVLYWKCNDINKHCIELTGFRIGGPVELDLPATIFKQRDSVAKEKNHDRATNLQKEFAMQLLGIQKQGETIVETVTFQNDCIRIQTWLRFPWCEEIKNLIFDTLRPSYELQERREVVST